MSHRSRVPAATLVVLMAVGAPARAARAPDLPPQAALHNERGVALVNAGDHEAAVVELRQAYASMPDALGQRAGRGKVLGSLRSALLRAYAKTQDPRHLCLLQTLLREHIEAILRALGDEARTDDVAGSLERLREVDAMVGSRCAVEPPARVDARELPVVRPTRRDAAKTPRRSAGPPAAIRTVGAVLLGVGVAGLGVMATGIILHADARLKLADLTSQLESSREGSTRTFTDITREAATVFDRGRSMRTMAIAGGILAGAALITGGVLRGVYQRRLQRTRVVPVYAAHTVGLRLSLAF